MSSLIGSLGLEQGSLLRRLQLAQSLAGLKRPSCSPHSFNPPAQLNSAKFMPDFTCEHEREVRAVGADLLLPSLHL